MQPKNPMGQPPWKKWYCRYCQDEKAPFSPNPVPGCSLWVNGSFYDNLNVK